MKTQYRHINFKPVEEKHKTKVWQCLTNRSHAELGVVKWYGPWRQYCYFPIAQAIYSADCLADIQDFINQVSSLHRLEREDGDKKAAEPRY